MSRDQALRGASAYQRKDEGITNPDKDTRQKGGGGNLVTVNGISKKFCTNLRRSMAYGIKDLALNLVGLRIDSSMLRKDEFWALDSVSFKMGEGEAVGLIGLNGSGKSTLLRMLAGILPPDKGEIEVRGRVGALIALGAGFHGHMTGRENIYLNGTVLGMKRAEIDAKFEDIVAFSELEGFLDAPVSTYSSGMRVRLGFAIAAHVNPDVVLVDEVLAVGDLPFRTKCLGRLNAMKRNGVSFILVSHDMTNIVQFTDRTIWLDKGKIRMDGPSLEVCSAYINMSVERSGDPAVFGDLYESHPDFDSASISLSADTGKERGGILNVPYGDHLLIDFDFATSRELAAANISFPIYHESGLLVTTVASIGANVRLTSANGRRFSGKVRFGPINFNPGKYIMLANLHDGPEHLLRSKATEFVVTHRSRLTWGVVDYVQQWQIAAPGGQQNDDDEEN